MATKSKIINGVSFELTWPYEAGHQITEAEAKALNQVRSENIGNNVRDKVKELLEAGKEDEAKALVAEKDRDYVFTFSTGAASRKLDPVEREARAIAREVIRNHLVSQGRKMNQVPEGLTKEEWDAKLEENIDSVASNEEVLKAAKKRVAEKAKTTQAIAESLSL